MRLPTVILGLISIWLSPLRATEYDLIIIAGQSNAVGFDAKPTQLPENPTDQQVLFWWKTGDPPPDEHDTHSSNAWTTLKPQPLGNPAPKNSAPRQYGNFAQPEGGFGPEFGFTRHLLAEQPERKLAVLKVAFSGTNIPTDWDPTKRDEKHSCYGALLAEFKKATTAAKVRGITLNPKVVIWIQGESDANKTNAPAYAENLNALIAAMRKDLAEPEMLVLLAVNTRFSLGKNPHVPAIVNAHKEVAASDPHCSYVDTSKAPIANAAHYNTEGTLLVGTWFGEQFLKFLGDPPPERPSSEL